MAQIQIGSSLLSEKNPARHSFLYLAGSIAFYQKQYLKAVEHFGQISANDSTWLGQTSGYLVARSYLNHAQRNWHGYSEDKSAINQDSLVLAVKWLQSYIHYFPNGSYIVSAERLLRKAYWLQSDLVRYEKQIKQELLNIVEGILQGPAFSQAHSSELETFITEYERKLKAPIKALDVLLSVLNKPIDKQKIDKKKMDKQKSQHPFYQFLQTLQHFTKAQQFYSQNQYQQAIDELQQLKQLGFKQKILMARSLAKLGQYEQSSKIFLLLREDNLLPASQTDTQMANNLIAQGGLKTLLNSDFNLNELIYQINLSRACSIEAVEYLLPETTNAQRRYHVIYELAIRYLYAGNINKLHQLLMSYSDSQLQELAMIKTAANMVANNTQSAKGYMNIAYFMENKIRRPRIDGEYLSALEGGQTNCQQSVLTPQSFDPYYYYKKALEQVEKPSLLEAKILHFLIYCHKTQDYTKACRWLERLPYTYAQHIDRSNPSKKWFERLHRQYKDSKWAESTPYYY